MLVSGGRGCGCRFQGRVSTGASARFGGAFPLVRAQNRALTGVRVWTQANKASSSGHSTEKQCREQFKKNAERRPKPQGPKQSRWNKEGICSASRCTAPSRVESTTSRGAPVEKHPKLVTWRKPISHTLLICSCQLSSAGRKKKTRRKPINL